MKKLALILTPLVLLIVGITLVGSNVATSAYSVISSAGSALTRRPTLNFVSGTTCVDNSGNNRTDCTSSGSGGYSTVQNNGAAVTQQSILNFINGGCVNNAGASSTDCTFSGSSSTGGGVIGYSAPAIALPTAGTTFIPPVGGGLASATEANVQATAPVAAAISNMYVVLSAAPGTGNTITFTYRDNAASKAVTCTISGASAKTCNDTTTGHAFTPTVGDQLAIQIVTTGTVVATPNIQITTQYGAAGGGSGGGGGNALGVCASLPTSGQTIGNAYKCTDWPLIYYFTSATASQGYYTGMPITPPPTCPTGTLAWVNQQSGGTCAQTVNGPLIIGYPQTTNGCCNSQLLVQTAPSTPYSYTTQVISNWGLNDNQSNTSAGFFMGLVIRESGTGKFTNVQIGYGGGIAAYNVAVNHWNSPTSPTGVVTAIVAGQSSLGVKIRDDGTNHYFYASTDGGAQWVLFYQEPRTTFMSNGGDQVGFFQIMFNSSSGGSGPSQSEFFDFTRGI